MKLLILLFLPLFVFAGEKEFLSKVSTKCGKITKEKEKSACVTGTFLEFCQENKNKKFCADEASRADNSKRTNGAKEGLKLAYKDIKKNGTVNFKRVFPEGTKDSYYYIFGVPSKCQALYEKGTPTHSASRHGLYERTKFLEKGIIKTLNNLPCPKKGSFKIYAIGQIDDDLTFDIWYVDNRKRIKHFRSDFKR